MMWRQVDYFVSLSAAYGTEEVFVFRIEAG